MDQQQPLDIAIKNAFGLTYKTKWDVQIWVDQITLTEDDVMIGHANPKPETVQRAHIARSDKTVKAIGETESLENLLKLFK